jgi:hypothetical protein
MGDDGLDDFDWTDWAADDTESAHDGAGGQDGVAGQNGHAGWETRGARAESALPDEDSDTAGEGWVVSGGVVRWEAPSEADDPRLEAQSPLAADDVALPDGAPDAPRVRAVHAWIARRRAGEHEALGDLLLAQREQRAAEEERHPPTRRRARSGAPEPSPLELALAEHQGAADEYDALLATLDDHDAHSGPGRALVEYYLWLVEHLAALAADPEARAGADQPSTLAAASWRGRAEAALAVRRRVERVTAPAAED